MAIHYTHAALHDFGLGFSFISFFVVWQRELRANVTQILPMTAHTHMGVAFRGDAPQHTAGVSWPHTHTPCAA